MLGLRKEITAELIGTFALTFVGAGAIMTGQNLLTVAAAHGLILAVMVSAVMNISGAHFNPAVSIGFLATGRMDGKTAGAYIGAQLAGAILAGGILASMGGAGAGTPAPGADVDMATVVLVEIVLTFLLMTVIMGTAVDDRKPAGIAGFAIGMVVMADILMGGPITGAAMNPARWMGTWVFTDMSDMMHVAMYWLGPVIGAVLATLVWDKVLTDAE